MKMAINNCKVKPEHILIDAVKLDIDIPTTSIIKGDLKSITISAASVIAKVTRDHMLYELDENIQCMTLNIIKVIQLRNISKQLRNMVLLKNIVEVTLLLKNM